MTSFHLCTYNHLPEGILDQIIFVKSFFNRAKLDLSISPYLDSSKMNILIENFSSHSSNYVEEFCLRENTKVFIIMTEHLDYRDGAVFFHEKLWGSSDYIDPQTQKSRVIALLELVPYIAGLLTLGDLPLLTGLNILLPTVPIYRIPFPPISFHEHSRGGAPEYDFLFTGYLNAYRLDKLEFLKKNYRVFYQSNSFSEFERDKMYRKARIILNIPQAIDWRWTSPMRVLAALRSGRGTVHIGEHDTSLLGRGLNYCDLADPDVDKLLNALLRDYEKVYESQYFGYQSTVSVYESEYFLPTKSFIEFWGRLV